jgi:hypothetical protein
MDQLVLANNTTEGKVKEECSPPYLEDIMKNSEE